MGKKGSDRFCGTKSGICLVASSTPPVSVRLDVSILRGESVPSSAGVSPWASYRFYGTSAVVFSNRDRLDVRGVGAMTDTAEVVTNQIIRDDSHKHLVHQAVNHLGSDSYYLSDSVSPSISRSRPFPAGGTVEDVVRNNDFRKEAPQYSPSKRDGLELTMEFDFFWGGWLNWKGRLTQLIIPFTNTPLTPRMQSVPVGFGSIKFLSRFLFKTMNADFRYNAVSHVAKAISFSKVARLGAVLLAPFRAVSILPRLEVAYSNGF